jgi:hypothetical protein
LQRFQVIEGNLGITYKQTPGRGSPYGGREGPFSVRTWRQGLPRGTIGYRLVPEKPEKTAISALADKTPPYKTIVRLFLVAVATHIFFQGSVRGRIARGDPDFTVFYTAGRLMSPLWFLLWMRWERIDLIAVFLLWWSFAIGTEIRRLPEPATGSQAVSAIT